MADGTMPAASPRVEADPGLTAAVAAIWADLLEVPHDAIGPDAHFFRLGGYSLLALRIVERLKAEHGLEVDIAVVLGKPLLADFVAALAADAAEKAEADADAEEGEL